jgi:hypothetical protein
MGVTIDFIFGNKPLGGSCRKRHYHKPWFDADCCIVKYELRLWLKTNPHLHVVKHQESKIKNLLKRNFFFLGNCKSSTYVCTCHGGCALVLEKVLAKGTVLDKISTAMLLESLRHPYGCELITRLR